jgi:menaquinol-cytochrome c reductase iron-sulfur subunit
VLAGSSPPAPNVPTPVLAPKSKRKSPYTMDRGIPGAFEGETVTRRGLFTGGALAAGGIASAAFGLPALGFALGPVLEDQDPRRWQDVGPTSEFVDENGKPLDFYQPRVITAVADIGEAGKTTIYVRADTMDPSPGIEMIAMSTRCTHAGCPVRYVQASRRFICPCHGGVYDDQGKRTGGPPVRPLDRFETRITPDKRVEVGDRYSVNSKLERKKPRDPSNHLDGIWQYLYPSRPTT